MSFVPIQSLPAVAPHSTPAWIGPIKKLGLAMVIAGLAVFVLALGLGNYRVTEVSLQAASAKVAAEHIQKLTPLSGQVFSSKFAALHAIEQHLNAGGTMSGYELQTAKFWILKTATTGPIANHPLLFLFLSIGLVCLGGLLFILPQAGESLPGIKHNFIFFKSISARGLLGIVLGVFLIGFYVLLYWYPELVANQIIMLDPISQALRRQPADQWFLYGTLYTLAVIVMGSRMLIKYRHSRYHQVRTGSIIFFQLGFAFLIPSIMERLGKPSMDFKNAWPLNYSFFTDWHLNTLLSSGHLGAFMLFWGVVLSIIVVPLMTYFFGKRWYCSWVCGCGGLAETLGDPFRQLSDKSLRAWKIERWMIYSVLVFAVVMTGMQLANYLSHGAIFGDLTWRVNKAYSFLIGSAFAGVVGVGFYPLMGNRVWCRFGCPLAGFMGLVQKFKSRFRITTNGTQCISCGNCSTYCEMGIDVRWYAQRGQNIVRASCVGCGVCAAVCPRGVLRLENGPAQGRFMDINAITDATYLSERHAS